MIKLKFVRRERDAGLFYSLAVEEGCQVGSFKSKHVQTHSKTTQATSTKNDNKNNNTAARSPPLPHNQSSSTTCTTMAKTKPQSNLHFRYRYNSRIKRPSFILLALIALNLVPNTFSSLDTDLLNLHKPQSTQHEHNVAILVSSSTFFHNYRHTTNTLSIYKALKKHGGYTDDNIILFLGDEVACNDRNPFKNKVFPYPDHVENIYEEFHTSSIGGHYSYDGANANGEDDDNDDNNNVQQFYYNDNVQVDYAGSDVTVENFFRVLLGRHNANTPPNQKIPVLNSNNSKTNLLLYMTGHGGDHFFKFRDQEDFTTADLRGAFEQLQIMKRFNSILFISDTCQAFTMAPNTEEEDGMSSSGIVLKNVYTVGTSLKDESSYAHHT